MEEKKVCRVCGRELEIDKFLVTQHGLQQYAESAQIRRRLRLGLRRGKSAALSKSLRMLRPCVYRTSLRESCSLR